MQNDKLRRRFLRKNPDSLTDAELLELLLSFTSDDPAATVQKLFERYPNIAALMEADTGGLSTIEGVEESSVLLLRLVPELHRRYLLSTFHKEAYLQSNIDFGRYLLPYFYGARDEMVYQLMLDGAGRVLNCLLIGHGSVNSVNVPIRRMVQEALNANASVVVLAHNHPSGLAVPSNEDIALTSRLRDALEMVDILLADHLIIADDDFVSMKDTFGFMNR